mmetsp:Transcript_29895/g.45715  ORF Transcript_29895/g.45715 Transcript_29895/m.45715 type:complete len:92 (+) Transcript_29895:2449-2724(+)
MGKKQEVWAKRVFKNADPKNLSAVPSDPYGNRFQNFMKEYVFQKSEKEKKADQEKLVERMNSIRQVINQSIFEKMSTSLGKSSLKAMASNL